ncbi:hypothetical protein J2Z21_005878 [Streptomyces griseochromogenes]|uniref:Uncharacterized protein n=1 Tax=Streptomyces griseochromogenes TaxID=68214 RepID=A0ABS4LZQ1_9ACTN|nr:hypothetical protein [Streptomyces griseochromogenes]MBP2052889.1 hypothetical protein [Streptomyces griseochromogenes]
MYRDGLLPGLAAAGAAVTVSLGIAAPIACTEAPARLPPVTRCLELDW